MLLSWSKRIQGHWVLYLAALFLLDQPRRDIPAFWQDPLTSSGLGHFTIQRQGDLRLTFIRARLGVGPLEIVPVPYYRGNGPTTRSVADIAERFGLETRHTVLAAINGGFFDVKTGLPIGFLLRDGRMEFFNMPQGFRRSMVGFAPRGQGARVFIASPSQMPKVWIDTGRRSLPVHHINVPGGKDAFTLYSPTWGAPLVPRADVLYLIAEAESGREGTYRIREKATRRPFLIPARGMVVALSGQSQALVRDLPVGTLFRPRWNLPEEWTRQGVTHGLLAGPCLVSGGRIHVTSREERLAALRSPDRVALGVSAAGDALLIWLHHQKGQDLSFERVAQVMVDMGVVDAIALDGGRSRALLTQGYFDGGRPVSNALVLAIPNGRGT